MHKRILLLTVLVVVMSVGLLGGASTVQADNPKPSPQPVETISINFTKVEFSSFQTNGSPGPDLILNGHLHLVSQALLDGGTPIGFRLRTNLMNTFASSEDGMATYVAVGSSDGIPADCTEPCMPPSWTVMFRLVPRGPAGQSNLLFDLTVMTTYDANGSLVSACIVGQDGCEVIIP